MGWPILYAWHGMGLMSAMMIAMSCVEVASSE